MGMLDLCRDPREEVPAGETVALPGEPFFSCDALAELASIILRNCSLFIAAAAMASQICRASAAQLVDEPRIIRGYLWWRLVRGCEVGH